MKSFRLWAASILAALCCLGAAPANAGLKLCNRTSYVVYAATAFPDRGQAVTQGWTRIVPGTCQMAIKQALTAPAYYVYARTSLAHSGASRAWGGAFPFCVKDTNFSATPPIAGTFCPSDDMFDVPFAQIDTHHMRSWTMTFSEAPDYGSMDQAARAGLKRLLRDDGSKIAGIDERPDKALDDALAALRKRLHLDPQAGNADLFDALETEALKTAAPAGYAVCNDTAGPIWAALGQKSGNNWVSRGWWKIAPGSCAKAITETLVADKIYLLAQKPNGTPIVTGAAKFCVTNIEFEVQDRTRCAKRGLVEAGFAETDTKGRSGYVAHVGDRGLITPLLAHEATSK